MAKIALVRNLSGFIPAYDSDFEIAKKIKIGEIYEYDFKKPRNYEFHKKFFGLINLVFQNQERYKFLDSLREDLIIEAGYYYEEVNLHGEVKKKVKSISFASMDEIEFSELYSSVVDVIIKYFHFDKQDIIDNVSQYF